ncbi:MAG TPA: DUF4956 domain-containing protein [Pyrinomonadaceae bacterium]|jgi:uncharacterized membrane protein YhiD involved in acid resistance
MNKTKTIIVSAAIAAFLLLCLAAGALLMIRGYSTPVNSATASNSNTASATAPTPAAGEIPILPEVFGAQQPANANSSVDVGVLQIILRLIIAVILSAILAFRPRKNVRLFERNLYVAQTQILLAVVAAALMMIVGDNAARAFAIFAAVSLVRFRTNIRDPKEVTVLLICLALGLAAGVGRWDLGVALCLFVLVLLRLLEYKEPEQAYRSMEVTVKTRNTETTQVALKKVFEWYKLETEVRQFNPPDEADPIGCIVYYLNLRLNLSTDNLSEQILALDPNNIDGIQWEQKKSATDIYQ